MLRTTLTALTLATLLGACTHGHPGARSAAAPSTGPAGAPAGAATPPAASEPAAAAPEVAKLEPGWLIIPEVYGLTRAAAEAKLRAAGVDADITLTDEGGMTISGCDLANGLVCGVRPPPGERAWHTSPVELEVQGYRRVE